MIIIARREIDVRPIIGAVVVFGIIGAAIFGIYYFLFIRPAAEELEQAKLSAFNQINSTLAVIGTDRALEAASGYTGRVQDANSKSEVNAILVEVASTVQLEQKHKEVLDRVDTATNGTFFSTANVPELAALSQSLKEKIHNMTTISQLDAYVPQIDNQATLTWRTYFTNSIVKMTENRLAMIQNSPAYGEYISKEEALAYVAGKTWHILRKLKFENPSTVEVPVLDTFQRTPTIKPNSTVKVYVYDIATDNMRPVWGNATVRSVIYSQTDIATIAWALTDGDTIRSYSVNMWDTIKAAAAGDAEAAAVAWQDYGVDLMDRARSANIGDYSVSVIYIVEVPDDIGAEIIQYELHMTATKDVILVAIVE
ncbi:MAG: hypothetical protein ACE5OT_02825 [Candidatus Hadarchaeaceae archaeon]